MLFTTIIDDFVQYSTVERGLSPRTMKSWRNILRGFHRFAESQTPDAPGLPDFTVPLLKKYLYHLSGKKLRPRTIRSKFICLIALGEFLKEQGAIAANPARSIKTPKLDAPTQARVSDDEVRQCLAAATRLHPPQRAALATAMLHTLAYAALRRQELTDLRLGDVSLADKAITVTQGKGMKRRVVYPHPDCIQALRHWLVARPAAKHDYLWAYDKNRRLAYLGIGTLLAEVKAAAGLSDHDNIKCHAFRRNCATRLLQGGADIRAVQGLLGHSLLETTAIYLSADEQRLRQISHLGGLGNVQDTPPRKQKTARFNKQRRATPKK